MVNKEMVNKGKEMVERVKGSNNKKENFIITNDFSVLGRSRGEGHV